MGAQVRVQERKNGTVAVTTASGATTLAEIRRREAGNRRWTVTETHPTGAAREVDCGSEREALGRAVEHALNYRRDG